LTLSALSLRFSLPPWGYNLSVHKDGLLAIDRL